MKSNIQTLLEFLIYHPRHHPVLPLLYLVKAADEMEHTFTYAWLSEQAALLRGPLSLPMVVSVPNSYNLTVVCHDGTDVVPLCQNGSFVARST